MGSTCSKLSGFSVDGAFEHFCSIGQTVLHRWRSWPWDLAFWTHLGTANIFVHRLAAPPAFQSAQDGLGAALNSEANPTLGPSKASVGRLLVLEGVGAACGCQWAYDKTARGGRLMRMPFGAGYSAMRCLFREMT